MKTVVVYKWTRDPEDAVVHADGSIDWRNATRTPSEDDPAAVEIALAVSAGQPVVGLTLGDGDPSWALARGVAEAVVVADAPTEEDDAATAELLAAAIRWIGDVDLVVVGDGETAPGVAPVLAALLDRPALLGVTAARAGDGRVEATRRREERDETLSLPLPALLGVVAAGAEKRQPGMKEVLAARKRPVTTVTTADLAARRRDPWVCHESRPAAARTARLFDGPAAGAARGLLAALRADGVL